MAQQPLGALEALCLRSHHLRLLPSAVSKELADKTPQCGVAGLCASLHRTAGADHILDTVGERTPAVAKREALGKTPELHHKFNTWAGLGIVIGWVHSIPT